MEACEVHCQKRVRVATCYQTIARERTSRPKLPGAHRTYLETERFLYSLAAALIGSRTRRVSWAAYLWPRPSDVVSYEAKRHQHSASFLWVSPNQEAGEEVGFGNTQTGVL